MSDYVKSVEEQNEELRLRLANSERQASFYRSHIVKEYHAHIYHQKPEQLGLVTSQDECLGILDTLLHISELKRFHVWHYYGTKIIWVCDAKCVGKNKIILRVSLGENQEEKVIFRKTYTSFKYMFKDIVKYLKRKNWE